MVLRLIPSNNKNKKQCSAREQRAVDRALIYRPVDEGDRVVAKQFMKSNKPSTVAKCGIVVLVAALAAGVGGCGMSSLTSGLGGGMFGASSKQGETKGVSEEQLLSAAKSDGTEAIGGGGGEVAHGCPRFVVWPRDNNLTIYEAGRVGDGLAVVHRGEITKTARECSIEPGRVTVKYGFSGRVLMGPKGKPGPVAMPLNVFVTDSKRERIATDKVKVDTSVSLEKPIGYFSAVRSVTFPIPEGSRPGEFEIYVGFDRSIPGAG